MVAAGDEQSRSNHAPITLQSRSNHAPSRSITLLYHSPTTLQSPSYIAHISLLYLSLQMAAPAAPLWPLLAPLQQWPQPPSPILPQLPADELLRPLRKAALEWVSANRSPHLSLIAVHNVAAGLPGGSLYRRFAAAYESAEVKTIIAAFHGTAEANVDPICVAGLDPSMRACEVSCDGFRHTPAFEATHQAAHHPSSPDQPQSAVPSEG